MSEAKKTDHAAENRELYEQFREGNASALERLIELNKRIAFDIAKKYYFVLEERPAYDFEDIQQIAMIGLWEAITSVWDPDKGGLYTPAKWVISRKMRRILKSNRSSSLNAPMPGGEDQDTEKQDFLPDLDAIDPQLQAYASTRCQEYFDFMADHADPEELNQLKLYCLGYIERPARKSIESALFLGPQPPIIRAFREKWLGDQISYFPSPMARLGKIRIVSSFSDPTAEKALKRIELVERLESRLTRRLKP